MIDLKKEKAFKNVILWIKHEISRNICIVYKHFE